MTLNVNLPSPNKTTLILCSIVLFITLLSLLSVILRHNWGIISGGRLFYMDEEANLPTWYSFIALLYSSLLAWLIAHCINKIRAPFAKTWTLLGCALFFMSMDEFMQIHEAYMRLLRKIDLLNEFGYNAWLVIGIALVAIVAPFMARMWWHLPARFKLVFFCSTLIFFGGSIIVEFIANNYAEKMGESSLGYTLLIHVEEIMEMAGIVILINGLMKYLRTFTNKICFEIKSD